MAGQVESANPSPSSSRPTNISMKYAHSSLLSNASFPNLLLVSKLSLFDIVNTPGVAADLSHIATPAKVEGFLPPDEGLLKALKGADIVVIPAGVPRKPGVRGFHIV